MTICVLCGFNVPWGGMLGHKHSVHGESFPAGKRVRKVADARATKKRKKKRATVFGRIFSGGLPSLGKRR